MSNETVQATLPLNIYQRLNEVRKQVAYVQKDKEVAGQGYKAVTHDLVTAMVRPQLVEQNVLVIPTLVSSRVADTGTTTGKGTPIIRYEGTYDIAFVNGDSPVDDRVVIRLESHALDQGDKAPGKAISYAVKYAMLKLLSIETGEDEEARFEEAVKKGVHKPTDGAVDRIDEERRIAVRVVVSKMKKHLAAGHLDQAVDEYRHTITDPDEKAFLWTFFNSKERNPLKRVEESFRQAEIDAALSEPQRRRVQGVVEEVRSCVDSDPLAALAILEAAKFSTEEGLYAWTSFTTRHQRAMSKARADLSKGQP